MALEELKKYVDSLTPEELVVLQRIVNGPDCSKKMDKVGGKWGDTMMTPKDFDDEEESPEETSDEEKKGEEEEEE